MRNNSDYDPDVNYDALEQHTYDDYPGQTWYTCPRCGNEYIPEFITEEDGVTMCIDCWSKEYNS